MCASLTWVLSSDFKEAIVSSLSLICFCSSSISFFSSAICFNKSFSFAYIKYRKSLKPLKQYVKIMIYYRRQNRRMEGGLSPITFLFFCKVIHNHLSRFNLLPMPPYIFKISQARKFISMLNSIGEVEVMVNEDALNENVISQVKSWIWCLLCDIPQFLFREKH